MTIITLTPTATEVRITLFIKHFQDFRTLSVQFLSQSDICQSLTSLNSKSFQNITQYYDTIALGVLFKSYEQRLSLETIRGT